MILKLYFIKFQNYLFQNFTIENIRNQSIESDTKNRTFLIYFKIRKSNSEFQYL